MDDADPVIELRDVLMMECITLCVPLALHDIGMILV
jgi:hypothetical protein